MSIVQFRTGYWNKVIECIDKYEICKTEFALFFAAIQ